LRNIYREELELINYLVSSKDANHFWNLPFSGKSLNLKNSLNAERVIRNITQEGMAREKGIMRRVFIHLSLASMFYQLLCR
jgi:hypothetical protein